MNKPAETKGANILSAVDVLGKAVGQARFATILEGLSGESGERLRSKSLSSVAWYPAQWYGNLLEATQSACFGDPALMRDTGYSLVQRDLSGIYSILVKLISPSMIVSWGPRTFGQYYRGGKLEITTLGEGAAQGIYTDWHGFNRPLWQTIAGGVKAAIAACGGKQVRAEFITGGVADSARMAMFWSTR